MENPFERRLTERQYSLLAAVCERVDLPARLIIFRQGGAAAHLYLILKGSVQIRYKPYDGPRITITHLHPGDVFGWSAVIGNSTYTSDAVSTAPLQALRVRGSALRRLCSQNPDEGAHILDALAVAVSPRWLNARRQVAGLLHAGMGLRLAGAP